jgi:hypothetical protein
MHRAEFRAGGCRPFPPRQFKVGEPVATAIDATQSSACPRVGGERVGA